MFQSLLRHSCGKREDSFISQTFIFTIIAITTTTASDRIKETTVIVEEMKIVE
jgi:hypothetical protein